MRCSIELWLHFLFHAFRSLLRFRSPLTIDDQDILARQLYSGHVNASGRIFLTAFIASTRNNFGLSLDRWDKAPGRLFLELAKATAKKRGGKITFKGFAHFEAASLRTINQPDIKLRALAAPTHPNPFHANIAVPPDRDEDYYLLVASELLNTVQPVPCLIRD